MALTVGSLFAGIGGFDLGFERAGFDIKWQVEIDPFCRAVLAKHWPDVRRYEDVREVGAELESIDILCGGFPCQDISNAGKQAGIDGARSGLWSHYARLVGELRPAYVVVENVEALVVRGLGRVLGDLADIGYDAEWQSLPASAFGCLHERRRLWIVAYPAGAHGEGSVLGQGDKWGSSLEFRRLRSVAVATEAWRTNKRLESEPELDRLVHGIPDRTHRLHAAGNSIVPQIAEWIARRILEAEERQIA